MEDRNEITATMKAGAKIVAETALEFARLKANEGLAAIESEAARYADALGLDEASKLELRAICVGEFQARAQVEAEGLAAMRRMAKAAAPARG